MAVSGKTAIPQISSVHCIIMLLGCKRGCSTRTPQRHATTSSSSLKDFLPKVLTRKARHCGCSSGGSCALFRHFQQTLCRNYKSCGGASRKAELPHLRLPSLASPFSARVSSRSWWIGTAQKMQPCLNINHVLNLAQILYVYEFTLLSCQEPGAGPC